ncbi:MAG: RNA methyltransferase [Acidobacteriota bacterium]
MGCSRTEASLALSPDYDPMNVHNQPVRTRVRELTSATNSLVKVFRRALTEGVTRDGWLCGEGPHFLEEALKPGSHVIVHSVLAAAEAVEKHQSLLSQLPYESEVATVPDRLFRQVAGTRTPQGIAALVELPRFDLKAVVASRDAVVVVACGLQDPGNMGTIIRSADALGASAVVALAGTVSPFNPKAVRSCVGSIFRMPVFAGTRSETLFKLLRGSGVRILGADRHSAVDVSNADLRGSIAVLVGQEAAGLPPEISREADELLSIPIRAEADSLNAATAAGIFLYEIARQRSFQYRHELV